MIKPRRRPEPPRKWPADVPGGTPLDRARYIAQQAIRELARYSATAAEAYVRTAVAFGETWVTSHVVTNHGDWLTREEAALFAGVKPRTIDQWVQRRHIRHYPEGYSRRELLDYQAKRGAMQNHAKEDAA